MHVRPKHTLPSIAWNGCRFPNEPQGSATSYTGRILLKRMLAFKMLQNLHEYSGPLGEHGALRNQWTQRLPLLRNQHPRRRRSLSQSRIAVGAKFAYREPRLEVFKDLERQEGKRRASTCDKRTNHRLARPATRAKCQRFSSHV